MAHEPGHLIRKNLYEIDLYARKGMEAFQRGIDVVPAWLHHKIATARAHMKDVGHFIRYEAHEGRRYSGKQMHELCLLDLKNIAEYAGLVDRSLQRGQQNLPDWAQHKLSIVAEYMDCVGHYLEARSEGRRYSYPAWQTQEFQMDYKGPRAYAQTKEYDTERSVAAIGGVRWVAPPALPGERRYGVPGHPYGTPGWAGQGGVAQRPLAVIRGARNKRGLKQMPHVYGSEGYGSMGDGSMDLATGGERMRRYAICPSCGDHAVVIEEQEGRSYASTPGLKDPFRDCVKIIDPFTNQTKIVCRKGGGGGGPKTIGMQPKDPFESTKPAGLSLRGRRRRKARRKSRRSRRRYRSRRRR